MHGKTLMRFLHLMHSQTSTCCRRGPNSHLLNLHPNLLEQKHVFEDIESGIGRNVPERLYNTWRNTLHGFPQGLNFPGQKDLPKRGEHQDRTLCMKSTSKLIGIIDWNLPPPPPRAPPFFSGYNELQDTPHTLTCQLLNPLRFPHIHTPPPPLICSSYFGFRIQHIQFVTRNGWHFFVPLQPLITEPLRNPQSVCSWGIFGVLNGFPMHIDTFDMRRIRWKGVFF